MVVFGRPKGHLGWYRQWEEGNIPPQVVSEIWSPGNRFSKMEETMRFYERYGVEDYYIYYPESGERNALPRNFASWALTPNRCDSGS